MPQELIQEPRQEEGPVFVPYGFRPDLGDCAESDTAKDVSKASYGDHTSFKIGTRTIVKRAP